MNKIVVFYIFVCILMFTCLTSLFSALRIEQYLPIETASAVDSTVAKSVSEVVPPFTLEEFSRSYRRGGEIRVKIRLPELFDRYMYSVSNAVQIYDRLDFGNARVESLRSGGVFLVEQAIPQDDDSWVYVIQVNDGRRNYQMYVPEASVESAQFYGQRPPDHQIEIRKEIRRSTEEQSIAQTQALEMAYEQALLDYHAFEARRHPTNHFAGYLKSTWSELSSIKASGMMISAALAGVITLFVAFFLGTVTWLRNSRAWEADVTFDDVGERGADYYEDDEEIEEPVEDDDGQPANRFS